MFNIGYQGSDLFWREKPYPGDRCRDGKVLHWNGPAKPWDSADVGCLQLWNQYDILSLSKSKNLSKSVFFFLLIRNNINNNYIFIDFRLV